MLALEWRSFDSIETQRIENARVQFHAAIQNVAAVGRRFLKESPNDEYATLFWVPGLLRLAGHWVEGNTKFRSSISFSDFNIYLVDDRVNTISSFAINGHTHRQIMLWLEEQIGTLGLSASMLTLSLPYELQEYPQLNGIPFDLEDTEAMEELGKYYHNAFLVLREFKIKQDLEGDINIWPHHFDAAISVTLKETGDLETDTSITLGMMPGDESSGKPYYYVSTWPHVHTSKMKPFDGPGNWIEEDWTGAILTDEELKATINQKEALNSFYDNAFSVLTKTLTE